MTVRCSAKQIANFVVLLGMTGTIPEYCENAGDAQNLKSLDLIISTLNIFVEAFDLYFEDIYRKYEMNFPLSEEKFIEFLKPRCLLLTKDNRCFNFILVGAFVFEMIHSFSHYNKCFHLVKVASKCLAAILQNRFKKIFETDSDWEELMSFCIKMHGSVYPPADKCESDGKQLVGVVTDKTGASFLNTAQELAELSIEKYVTDDNNDDYSDTKTTRKISYISLQSHLSSEIKEEELEDLNSSEFPTSSPAHTLQLAGEGPSKSENKEKTVDENNRKKDNEKDYVKDTLLDFSKEFLNVLGEKVSIRNNVTEKPEKNLTRISESYLAIKTEAESSKDLGILGLSSTDASHAIQLKFEDLSPKEENVCNENDKKGNDKEFSTGTTDSLLQELANEFIDMVSEQTTNNDKTDNERLVQIPISKKNIILSFEDYLEFKKVVGKLEDLCNLGLPSTRASHKLQSKIEDSPPEQAEDKEKIHDGNDARKDNGRDYTTDMAALHESTKKSPDVVSENATLNNNKDDNEKLDEMTGFKKSLTLSYEDYSAIKKVLESLEDVCKLGLSSTGALHTSLLKVEDSSPKDNKEKIHNQNEGERNNAKDCVQDMTVSLVSKLEEESTNIAINNKDDGIGNLVPMIGCMKPLIRSCKKELAIRKIQEMLQLRNLESDSSTGASYTCMNGEDFSPNAESEHNKMIVDESNAKEGKENATFSLVPNLTRKPTKTSIEKKDIDKNLKGAEKLGQMNSCRKKLSLPLSKDLSAQKAAKKLSVSHNLEFATSLDARPNLQLEDENAESEDTMRVDESNAKAGNKNSTFSLVSELPHEPTEIEKKALDKNLKGAEKPGQMSSCRKKLSLPLSKDLSAQKAAKKLAVSHNLESVTSLDARPTPQLKDEKFSSKNIRNMPANEIRTCITDDSVHLLKVLKLLKICEEDIGPNRFSKDEYDIPINGADENVEMEAGCGISESSRNSDIIFKSYIKATIFYKGMKMANSIKRILHEDNPSNDKSPPKTSGGESTHEMSDEVVYVHGIGILESDDPHCSLCAGGMERFFDAYVNNFKTKYSNNNEVSYLFQHEDSE